MTYWLSPISIPYNGQVYQVGEFSQDVTVDSTQGVQKVIFLKLPKATSQRPTLPIWGLMMKNVYSLDVNWHAARWICQRTFYTRESGGLKDIQPKPMKPINILLTIYSTLIVFNNRNDPFPDGQYDYVDSFTVLSQQGKIIFRTWSCSAPSWIQSAFKGADFSHKTQSII